MVGFISRAFMYGLILGLALFVAATYFLVDTGGGSTAAAREVSVQDLATSAATFNGEDVITTGALSFSEEHGTYQVTDDGVAIVIRGYSDEALLGSLSGKTVQVTGKFSYDAESGTYIEASAVIEVVEE